MQKEKLLLPIDTSSADTPWLWIGTWSMGGEGFGSHNEREALKVLESAALNNIRHFDTAGFYAHGGSELLLQKIIKKDRKEFFISSKGGLFWNGRNVEHRASPEDLRTQLYKSLERLNTDYLDLYQLHWPAPDVPIDTSISALKEFQKDGLIRFWGVGNLTEQQVKGTLSGEINIPHQVHFNPIHRNAPLLLSGKDHCIHCIVSPLEQGLLGTGKSSFGISGIGKKDFRKRNPYFSKPEVQLWSSGLNHLLKDHPLSKISLVLMWICSRPHVHAVIPGPRKVNQLREILVFRSDIENYDLMSSPEGNSILDGEKVKNFMPDAIWHHLSRGPDLL